MDARRAGRSVPSWSWIQNYPCCRCPLSQRLSVRQWTIDRHRGRRADGGGDRGRGHCGRADGAVLPGLRTGRCCRYVLIVAACACLAVPPGPSDAGAGGRRHRHGRSGLPGIAGSHGAGGDPRHLHRGVALTASGVTPGRRPGGVRSGLVAGAGGRQPVVRRPSADPRRMAGRARTPAPAGPTSPASPSGRPNGIASGRSAAAGPSPTSGCASPGSCTMSWPTP